MADVNHGDLARLIGRDPMGLEDLVMVLDARPPRRRPRNEDEARTLAESQADVLVGCVERMFAALALSPEQEEEGRRALADELRLVSRQHAGEWWECGPTRWPDRGLPTEQLASHFGSGEAGEAGDLAA